MLNAIVFRVDTVEVVSKCDSTVMTSEAVFMIVMRDDVLGMMLMMIPSLALFNHNRSQIFKFSVKTLKFWPKLRKLEGSGPNF